MNDDQAQTLLAELRENVRDKASFRFNLIKLSYANA